MKPDMNYPLLKKLMRCDVKTYCIHLNSPFFYKINKTLSSPNNKKALVYQISVIH
jgi:N6-adenosine-specific RNA methylase IME4